MKVKEYNHEINRINLVPSSKEITIGKGYYDDGTNQWPLVYQKNHHIYKSKPYVYKINLFGQTTADARPFYIALNFWENIRFKWIQGKTWVHDKDNIMWFINIMVAILAIIGALRGFGG